jgi:purine-nucleoside phosphorylase
MDDCAAVGNCVIASDGVTSNRHVDCSRQSDSAAVTAAMDGFGATTNIFCSGGQQLDNGISRHQDDLETNQDKFEAVESTTRYILSRIGHSSLARPQTAIICGSGLGGLAELMDDVIAIPYTEIPNFVTTSVKGHAGQLVFGTLNGSSVVCMHGRLHAYEGHSMWQVTFPIRVFHGLGVRLLIVTNASGSVNPDYSVGDIMIIKDHINLPGLAGLNPLFGLHDERFGPRFPVMADAYDEELRCLLKETARDLGLEDAVHEGVYAYVSGPCYETVAERRMLRLLGGDAVGMSTVPEVIVGRHGLLPMRCVGLALITNVCASDPVTVKVTKGHPATSVDGCDNGVQEVETAVHDVVLNMAESRTADMGRLVSAFISRLSR